MSDLFSMRGRANRSRYAAATVLAPIAVYIVAAGVSATDTTLGQVISLLLILATYAVSVCQTVRRLHDIGRPGTHFWLLLIPLYNVYLGLVLLFRKGDATHNRYGANPLSTEAQLATV